MKFEGEHLIYGQLGHFFVILSFVAALLATLAYGMASSNKMSPDQKLTWVKLARIAFFTQFVGIIIILGIVFYICKNHFYEYMYVYKHASMELEAKYLLACIWEGQEGSFLLWSICHAVLGSFLIFNFNKKKNIIWEAPVMSVVSLAQVF